MRYNLLAMLLNLFAPFEDKNLVSGKLLSLFRIFFGCMMFVEMCYYIRIDFIQNGILSPKLLFPYDGLEWIQVLPEPIMQAILFISCVACIFIILGRYTSIAAAIFALGQSYFFLLDKSYYNNHIYLFILLAFLLIWVDSEQHFVPWKKKKAIGIPYWQIWIFRLQIFVVYFMGGIAKLNSDWLVYNEPMRHLAQSDPSNNLLLFIDNNEIAILILSYGGLLFDLCIGFLLFMKPYRKIAIISLLFFNISNAWIFNDIGIFPFMMIGSTLIFFDVEHTKSKNTVSYKPLTKILIGSYVAFQFLFPLRHLLLPNNADWSSIGQRFSWHMKIQYREISEMKFSIENTNTGATRFVNPGKVINTQQLRQLSHDPRMLQPFANYLKERTMENGVKELAIYCSIKLSYNGRPNQYLLDPNYNILNCDYNSFEQVEWLNLPADRSEQ